MKLIRPKSHSWLGMELEFKSQNLGSEYAVLQLHRQTEM